MHLKKKQILSVVICVLMILSLAACGKNENNGGKTPPPLEEGGQQSGGDESDGQQANGEQSDGESDEDSGNDEAGESSGEQKDAGDEEQTDGDQIIDENETDTDTENKEIRDVSSLELVKEIKIGWNLGNTLDATGGGKTINSETSWGNPITTKAVIDKVKEAGFNTVRIPVSWGNHLGEAPDYTVDKAWMNRVNDVVDYAIENDMFVIINLHHEEWHFPSNDNLETAKSILIRLWEQIAERFAGYDEHLIFEGMNEPRMVGTSFEWNGGNPESRGVINQLNGAFIETVRNSGGNNPKRHLMIPSYAASSDPKTWNDMEIPQDDKIIVSIHAYTPYNFALNEHGTDQWSLDNPNDVRDIDNLMKNLNEHFISKGQPVILGEFGARSKNNLEARAAWAEYYIKKATEIGVPCIWWDNGAFVGTGELFGLLNRRQLIWQYPEIVDALMKGLEQ